VIGTLDTKTQEITYLAELIESMGGRPTIMDASTGRGDQASAAAQGRFPLVTREDVARAAGTSGDAIATMERGEAISVMRGGIAALAVAMADAGEIAGAICIGGAGAHLAGPAFQALALGFPKLIVTPLASGHRTFEPYVGLRDVAVLHSVADIAGINSVTAPVYLQAAGYIVGAARAHRNLALPDTATDSIAVSMNGNTTPALTRARSRFEAAGFSCVTFHANGVGGRALEDFVASGRAVAALDFTTTELSAHLVGGLMDSGPDRMEAAGRRGIPQVLVPGCVDFITCGRWDDAEREFPGRLMFRHNPELTLVHLTVEEMAEVGRAFARKASTAAGPTTICVPMRGFSVHDCDGGEFWDRDADAAFVAALQEGLSTSVQLRLIDAHINDDDFSDIVVEQLLALLGAGGPAGAVVEEIDHPLTSTNP